MNQIKEILIHRLTSKGMDMNVIPGFIRSLSNSVAYYPHTDFKQVIDRLQYMGWDDFELDYFTFQLVIECLESLGFKKSEYRSAHWFESNFVLN